MASGVSEELQRRAGVRNDIMTYDQFIHSACPLLDLEWRKYRRRAARHHVQARMHDLGITDYEKYLERLTWDKTERQLFPNAVLVTVSRFFREKECWENIWRRVIPELIGEKESGIIHIWSAGCCGGEEPYTLAMIWMARLQELYPGWKMVIRATDIDDASLARAQRGEYGAGSLREVPREMLQRFFTRDGDLWRLSEAPRHIVSVTKHNLLHDPPPKSMDMVFCRYLAFTYFRSKRRKAALEQIAAALKPGGALVIGLKEGLTEEEQSQFQAWQGMQGIFRKKPL